MYVGHNIVAKKETVYHRLTLKQQTKVTKTHTTNLLEVNQQHQYEGKEDRQLN